MYKLKLTREEMARLLWMEALAASCAPPSIAVIGCRSGHELIALATGARRSARAMAMKGDRTVRCFHDGYQWATASRVLIERGTRSRMYSRRFRETLRWTVHGIWSRHPDRREWKRELGSMLDRCESPFRAVIHLGNGESARVRDEIRVMEPMMDDRTQLVLCSMDTRGPRAVFEQYMASPLWTGAMVFPSVGVLQHLSIPQEIDNGISCTA